MSIKINLVVFECLFSQNFIDILPVAFFFCNKVLLQKKPCSYCKKKSPTTKLPIKNQSVPLCDGCYDKQLSLVSECVEYKYDGLMCCSTRYCISAIFFEVIKKRNNWVPGNLMLFGVNTLNIINNSLKCISINVK
jgi:hypothetical protein